jgi:hypothetical protein
MAKSSGPLIVVAGAAALLLMGGKKKKSSSSTGGGGELPEGGGSSNGGGMGGGGSSGGGSGTSGGSGGKGDSSRAKSAGGIWVSSDCKKIEYENGTPEAWWNRRGESAAQSFVDANYHDPYEIARAIVIQLVPCAVEFPVMEDDLEPMMEEYKREEFLRNFKDAYYLIQWLHDAISGLLEREQYIVEFDDRCDAVFVGDEWLSATANRMIRFYLDYQYPTSRPEGYNEASWEGADMDEKNMRPADNVALAVINRMHPECAWQIRDAYVKDRGQARGFFTTRPGMKAAYDQLVDAVDYVDDTRPYGIDFEPMS